MKNGFYKVAEVTSLAVGDYLNGGVSTSLSKIARKDERDSFHSYYIDGSRKIDVVGMLKEASEKFNISANPADYLFEAIRANTVNDPNGNNDAFHRNELLRFDPKARKAVYLTYEGKPHHLQHNTSNPKRARGIILAAHFNDETMPQENCEVCNHHTADAQNRDPSGIHCSNCGHTVKDEFVEILVAVDTKKDEDLATGIRSGMLNAGSMGCSASSTVCNICNHTAHNVNQFCGHIKSGTKGSLWKREGTNFVRTNSEEIYQALRKAGYKVPPGKNSKLVRVALLLPKLGLEFRRAFEYCQGVEFEEYSRVHHPADEKARTIELLKAASANSVDEDEMSIKHETELFFLKNKVAELENLIRRSAQYQPDATQSLESANTGIGTGINTSADVQLAIPDGARVHIDDAGNAVDENGNPVDQNGNPLPSGSIQPGQPGQPNSMGPANKVVTPKGPQSIEDVTKQQTQSNSSTSPEEFGILPPGASEEGDDSEMGMVDGDQGISTEASTDKDEDMNKFAEVYNDLDLEIFADHAVLRAPSGDVLTIQASQKLASDEAMREFGQNIIDSLISDGLVRTAMKFEGSLHSKVADMTDGAMFDIAERIPESNKGMLEGEESDVDTGKKSTDTSSMLKGVDSDVDLGKRTMPKSFISDRDTDIAGAEKENAKSITEGHKEDITEKKPAYNLGSDSITDDAEFDIGKTKSKKSADLADEAKVEERFKKLYASRHAKELEKVKKEAVEQLETAKQDYQLQLTRALKFASKRQALNLEISPLKTALVDSLMSEREIGKSASTGEPVSWPGLDANVALNLVEQAWQDAAVDEVTNLITRAAEVLNYDEGYLVTAEADLAKQAVLLPSVIVADTDSNIGSRVAAHNFPFTSGPTSADAVESKEDALKRAFSENTAVGRKLEGIRPRN